MNLDHVRKLEFAPIEQLCSARDAALYALSLGVGDDPLDEDELPFVYEERGLLAVPSQCVTICWPPFWHRDPKAAIAWQRAVHGEQSFTLHGLVPVEGLVRAQHRILGAEDKGASRGLVLSTANDLFDAPSGAPLASLRSTEFLRDDGGSGGFGQSAALTRPLAQDLAPCASCEYRTSTQAALLYRQAGRDYMPIHADPVTAREAGFARPISHGLNTFGLACRAALKLFAPGRPERIASMSVRFAAPALPGDTIRVEFFETGDRLRFRAWALERRALVLDRGEFGLR